MPNFSYKIKDSKNDVTVGIVQASTKEAAAKILIDEGSTILSLDREKANFLQRSLKILNWVRVKDLVIFSRQLSVIVSATIPLVKGLKILTNQTENAYLKTVISEVADDVDGGAKLSAALSRHPEVFSFFYVSIIKSGETSGKLDEVLNYLADQQEKDYDLLAKIKGAMIYPVFILFGLVAVSSLMMVFVIPQLTSILAETGVDLPLSTRMLIKSSNLVLNFWWLAILLLIGVIAGLRVVIGTEKGRYYWDFLKLRMPIFGRLFQKMILVRFARSLNTLMSGGVPLSKSLAIVADITGNVIYKNLVLETAKEVESGNPIATALLKSSEVPPMVSQMLNLGERTGRIDEILDKLADFYTREVNNMVINLSTLIEPIIMIVMGVAVGFLVAAVILPMYNLAASL